MSTRYEYKTGHLTKEVLKEDYQTLKSIRKIAIKYNVHHSTISALLQKFQIDYKPRTRTKNNNIFSEENETSFYLAGFIAADGNVCHHKSNYDLCIGLSAKDEKHLIKLHDLLESNSSIRTYENNSYINGKNIKSTIKAFTVCSKQIYEDLNNNFLITPNKSLTLKFPEHLSNHPMIHHFIRGYFDGDGSWIIRNPTIKNKQSKINICFSIMGTNHFVISLNNILHSHLNLPNNTISQTKNVFRLRYSGNRLSSVIGDWIYKDATIFLERKYDRYLMAKSLYGIQYGH